jgi:hypothetical protein
MPLRGTGKLSWLSHNPLYSILPAILPFNLLAPHVIPAKAGIQGEKRLSIPMDRPIKSGDDKADET